MTSRIITLACRQIRPSVRPFAFRKSMPRRLASTQDKPSNVAYFYKTFTRPVAKVLLVAILTYQLAYWGWVKLEFIEAEAALEDEIVQLESQLTTLLKNDPAVRKAMEFLHLRGVDVAAIKPDELNLFARQSPDEQGRLADVYLAAGLDGGSVRRKAERPRPTEKLATTEKLQRAQLKLTELDRQIQEQQQLSETGGFGLEDGQESRRSSWWKFR